MKNTRIVSEINKGAMLDMIKAYLNIKKNTDLANYLGVSSQAVSNWYSRNTFDAELIYTKCAFVNPEWLLTGRGNMLAGKEYNAGRDNHVVEGDNKGVAGSGNTVGGIGTIGENSGTCVVMGGGQKAKKIIEPDKITVEMDKSAEMELLQRANKYLETRIEDLEKLNVSQTRTIEAMQILIDTLLKK
jgi:hypothetical protein